MKALAPVERVNHVVPYVPEACAKCTATLPSAAGKCTDDTPTNVMGIVSTKLVDSDEVG